MWHKTVNRDPDGLGITCRFTTPTAMSHRHLRAPQRLPGSFWTSSIEVVSSMIDGAVADLTGDTRHDEQGVVWHTRCWSLGRVFPEADQ
jgi:hypothetical protein